MEDTQGRPKYAHDHPIHTPLSYLQVAEAGLVLTSISVSHLYALSMARKIIPQGTLAKLSLQ